MKVPFVWIEPKPPACVPDRLVFRPLSDALRADFLTALRLSLSASLDRHDQAELARLGAEGLARSCMDVGTDFEYEQSWWHLAYTGSGDLVGFLQPVVWRGSERDGKREGAIYQYGIVPQHRGNGYGQDLLLKLTAVLQQVGVWRIFGDVDEMNVPSMTALLSAGYEVASDYPEFNNQGPWRSERAGLLR